MTTPTPHDDKGLLSGITELAKGLPPILLYSIVFGLVLILLLVIGVPIPPWIVYIFNFFAVAGVVGYLYWDWQQIRERGKQRQLAHELEITRLKQAHELELAKLKSIQPTALDENTNEPTEPQPKLNNQTTPPPTVGDPNSLEEMYLRSLLHDCKHMSVATIDEQAKQTGTAKLALDQIFVALDVPFHARGDEWTNEVPKDNRMTALTRLSKEEKLVLLGKPGSGKSTLVNFITYCLAGEALKHPQVNRNKLYDLGWTLPDLMPVRVILRDYAARGLSSEQSIMEFVGAEMDTGWEAYAPLLEKTLQHEGGLLLLDGLDEVPEAHQRREQLHKAILDFTLAYPKVRILVTSRPYAYDNPDWQLDDFAQTTLLDFNEEQIETYVTRWYEAMGKEDANLGSKRANQYAQQLSRELKRNQNLAELAPRPLLLTLMVSLHRWRGGGALPQEREKLYDQSVDLLIDLWQRPKQIYDDRGYIEREETTALQEFGISPAELRQALSEVAYEAHANQAELTGTADITARQLAGILHDRVAQDKDISLNRIIDYVKDRAGLLEDRGPNKKGEHIYAFPHRTFQEYLAACYLLETEKLEGFPQNLRNLAVKDLDRWREATLLAAGRTNVPMAVWSLVEALCDDPVPAAGQPISDEQWTGALLAGMVIREKGLHATQTSQHQKKLKLVKDWSLAMVERGALAPFDRNIGGQTLALLGDPRPSLVPNSVAELKEMPFCYVPAGAFWLGSEDGHDDEKPMHQLEINYGYWLAQYPVTVGQYRLFLQESGYEMQGHRNYFEQDGPNLPARWLTGHDALAFCQWLNEVYPLPDGLRFCLPSEAEWEKAARGGLQLPSKPIIRPLHDLTNDVTLSEVEGFTPNPLPQRRYPWGDSFEADNANGQTSGVGDTSVVGMFPPGQGVYGHLDLSGNVFEWTRSHWKSYPYQAEDGREARPAKEASMVIRGGSFGGSANALSCAFRNLDLLYLVNFDLGFRVCVPVSSSVPL